MRNQEHFRKRLEEEKENLERELASVGRKNPSVPNDYEAVSSEKGLESDVVDQADTITSFETNAAILNELELRYQSVLGALARIGNGTYGICEVGGEEIEQERLEANPAASTCKLHTK